MKGKQPYMRSGRKKQKQKLQLHYTYNHSDYIYHIWPTQAKKEHSKTKLSTC